MRIPQGWAVTYNRFYAVEPIINAKTGEFENWGWFTNRLLNVHLLPLRSGAIDYRNCLLIEVAWLPDADPTGCYHATLVANTPAETWQELLHFSHQDPTEIARQLYDWMERVNDYRWGSVRKPKDEASRFLVSFLKGLSD